MTDVKEKPMAPSIPKQEMIKTIDADYLGLVPKSETYLNKEAQLSEHLRKK